MSCGLFATLELCEDQNKISQGIYFKLNQIQRGTVCEMNEEHGKSLEDLEKRNAFLFGSSGTGKTLLLPQLMRMRIGFLLRKLTPKNKETGVKIKAVVTTHHRSFESENFLLGQLKEKHLGHLSSDIHKRIDIEFPKIEELCKGKK